MRRSDKHQLLDEVVTGAEVAEFREASLREALSGVRRIRRRRHAVRGLALVALPLMVLSLILLGGFKDSPTPDTVPTAPRAIVATPESSGSSSVEYISDEELLALFPDRPLALVGPEGRQQLVFLSRSIPN